MDARPAWIEDLIRIEDVCAGDRIQIHGDAHTVIEIGRYPDHVTLRCDPEASVTAPIRTVLVKIVETPPTAWERLSREAF